MVELQLDAQKTALVLIDLQNAIVGMNPVPHTAAQVVENSRKLAEAFRAHGAPVALAVYQAMLPLLREAPTARIVNVSSGAGSLARVADPAFSSRHIFGPGYSASKTAMNAMTLSMAIELESTNIKVNACSPGFIKTNLNAYEGTGTVEAGALEPVRLALLGPDGPTGTFTRWEGETIPW
jgi:NAD(P)-dependent dehydrogenase (short-subunit alcohol dehydrogenase family)